MVRKRKEGRYKKIKKKRSELSGGCCFEREAKSIVASRNVPARYPISLTHYRHGSSTAPATNGGGAEKEHEHRGANNPL